MRPFSPAARSAEGDDTVLVTPAAALAVGSSERAWVLLNRVGAWVARDASGQMLPNAVEKALADIDEVLRLVTGRYCTYWYCTDSVIERYLVRLMSVVCR
jgi:hypothetical protein